MLALKFVMVPVSILYVTLAFWRKQVFQRRGGEKFVFYPGRNWRTVQEWKKKPNKTKPKLSLSNWSKFLPDILVGHEKSQFVNALSCL